MKRWQNILLRAVPFVIALTPLLGAEFGVITAVVLLFVSNSQDRTIARYAKIGMLAAIVFIVPAMFMKLDFVSNRLAEGCIGEVFVIGALAARPHLGGLTKRSSDSLHANVDFVVVFLCILAIAVSNSHFVTAALHGEVFSNEATVLANRFSPWIIVHAATVLIAADSLLGSVFAFFIARQSGLGLGASAFAAAAWALAGSRISQQTNALMPTAVVPLLLLGWRWLSPRSPWLFAIASAAIGLTNPFLWAASMTLVIADALAFPERRLPISIIAALLPGAAASLASPALFMHHATLPNDINSVLRSNGGDGAYPWEWIFPNAVSAITAPLTFALRSNGSHLGNIYTESVASCMVVVVLAACMLFNRSKAYDTLKRFGGIAVLLGVFCALPSHVQSVPLPDLTLILSMSRGDVVNAAAAGMGGILGLSLIAAAQLDLLMKRRRTVAIASAYVCAALLIVDAPLSARLFWNPGATPLARQLALATTLCRGSISITPGIDGDDPVTRYVRFIVDGSDKERIVSNVPVSGATPRVGCWILDQDLSTRKLPPQLNDVVTLPLEFNGQSTALLDSTPKIIPGRRILSVSGDSILYAGEQ